MPFSVMAGFVPAAPDTEDAAPCGSEITGARPETTCGGGLGTVPRMGDNRSKSLFSRATFLPLRVQEERLLCLP